jgi:hypothetical protein
MENKLLTKNEFIKRANLKHNNKYNYDKVIYLGNKKKVEITCILHGVFWQIPNAHFRGVGCPKCSFINKVNYNRKEVFKEINKYKECSLYILNINTFDDSFIKIGVTKNDVKTRYYGTKKYFTYNIILELPLNIKEAFELEQKLLLILNKFKYTPKIKFPGYRECLNKDSKELILKELKYGIINEYNKSDLVGKILDYENGKI